MRIATMTAYHARPQVAENRGSRHRVSMAGNRPSGPRDGQAASRLPAGLTATPPPCPRAVLRMASLFVTKSAVCHSIADGNRVSMRPMSTIPTAPPELLVSGTSLQFTRALAEFPAPAWTLSYAAVKSGNRILFSAAGQSDGSHFVNVAMATTANWSAGTYDLQGYVSDGTSRHLVDHVTLRIIPDYAAQSAGYDGRSHARKVLDAIEAVLEGRAVESHLEIQVVTAGGTRRISQIPHGDLLMLRSRYQAEVAREQAANTGASARGRMRVTF